MKKYHKGMDLDDLSYSNKRGLGIESSDGKMEVALDAVDKLLGAKINDIEYNEDEGLPEIIIDLDNGSQIEIYLCEHGAVMIASD